MLDLESSGGDYDLPPLGSPVPRVSLAGELQAYDASAEFVSGITSGTCESNGLRTITSHDECVRATASTGFPVSDVHETTTPPGCWGVRGKAEICLNTFTA